MADTGQEQTLPTISAMFAKCHEQKFRFIDRRVGGQLSWFALALVLNECDDV